MPDGTMMTGASHGLGFDEIIYPTMQGIISGVDTGYGDTGYGDTGYGDTGYGDTGYGDTGYGDTGYDSGSHCQAIIAMMMIFRILGMITNKKRSQILVRTSTDKKGEIGDVVYTNNSDDPYDQKTYILKNNDSNNDPILVTESWGGTSYLNDSWMGGREVFAAEELDSENYIIAIKEIIDDQWSDGERITWQTIETSSTGVIDWNIKTHRRYSKV